MDEIQELIIIGVMAGMLLITISLLIYCYQKGKNKLDNKDDVFIDEDDKEDEDDPTPSYLSRKRPSDKFTIPIISMNGQIPFTIQEENVTKDDFPQIQLEHYYPPVSTPLPTYNEKPLRRSVSCPPERGFHLQYEDEEEEEDEGEDIDLGTIPGDLKSSRFGSEGTLLKQKSMPSKFNKKSTRGMLVPAAIVEGRKISVYQDTTMDVTQRTLARRRGTLLTQEESYRKAGMIHFSTEYLEDDKIFQVFVHRVTDLTRKNLVAQINPFARLYLSPDKKNKHDTKVFHDTKDPTFNEMIEFHNIKKEQLSEKKLKIKLYSQDRIMLKKLLGQVDILMSSLSFVGKETFDISLFKQRSTISMTSVSITLCHQATNSRLEVFVEKLKKVPKPPKGSVSSCIYGALTLRHKGDEPISRNTSIKSHTKDPIFEEKLTFQDLSTNSSTPLSSFSLLFSLVERNLLGQDQILGHVIFNTTSPQSSAVKQWEAVHNQPHINHTSWHYLVDPDELR